MEGISIRKISPLYAFVFWSFISATLLLITASALWAITESDDEGAPIWIAGAKGVLIASQSDGSTLSEIPLTHEARAIAADTHRDTLWVFSNKSLHGYTTHGIQKFSTRINPPNGQPAFIAVDASNGHAWLAVHSQLYHLDQNGVLLRQQRMPQPILAIALNRTSSQLWLAYRGGIGIYGTDGSDVGSVDTRGAKNIRALDYDQNLDQVWVVADNSLRRYATDGTLVFSQENAWFNDITHIAADQQGGLWAADKRQLAHIDQSGLLAFLLEPFSGSHPSAIVSLVSGSGNGSAWVASQRQHAQYAIDSRLIHAFAAQDKDGKPFLINQLALDTPSAAPHISILEPSDNSTLGTARPEFLLAIEGPEADKDSFDFRLNMQPGDFECTRTGTNYSCMPQQEIQDGQYLLTITVADAAGNHSNPAEVRFAVDTVNPTIEILSPENDLLTNQTSVQISGRISEPALLEIDGNHQTIQQDGTFSLGPFLLEEGENAFWLKAVDAAGNTGERTLHVTRDTIPPPAPQENQIQAQQQSDGTIRVSGAASSVEGGSTVTVVNTRTGERVTVVADTDGSFAATIDGENGDELQVYATDGAGNVGQTSLVSVVGDPFSGAITLSVLSPGNGSTVSDDKVLVVAEAKGPLNIGVTVNGIAAAAVPERDKLRFYATVPLTIGTNSLVVKAKTIDGNETAQTVNVGSTGPAAFSLATYPDIGIEPQIVSVQLTNQLGIDIQEVRYDFNNDGVPDLVTTDPFEEVTATISGVGIHSITANIVDASGAIRTQTANLVLQDPEQLNGVIQAVWNGMTSALLSGEKRAATRFLTEVAKEKYGPVFDVLIPGMEEIVNSYSPLQQSLLSPDMAEYGVNRTIDGTNRVFLIGFTTNENRQWQIDAM